ncbi:MAG: extracellular solute-binding protein [Clostridia bacterium]|nr:extracellular solute-binding protein [Clostridia bacterium]
MRHSHTFAKIISLVLVALTLATLFAACTQPSDDDVTTTTVSNNASTTPVPHENSGETTPSSADTTAPEYVYPDVTYDGAEFAMLNAEDRYNMIYHLTPDSITGDSLDDERYMLNTDIEERYKISLSETQIAYNDLLPYAQNEVLSNTPVHDVFFLSGKQIASLMSAGYMHNLLDIEQINIEAEWWDQTLIEDGTLNDKYLYYLGGNYHLQGFEGTTCIYFNKEMMADLGLEFPYQLARDGKWTFDKMYEYASSAASLNGDESFEYNAGGSSVYGIACINNMMPAFIMGGNAYYVEKNANDEPVISFTSEHFQNVCTKIASLTSTAGVFKAKNEVALFMDNRALMMGGEIKAAANEMRNMQSEFGLLPVPKYDESQANYVTNMYWGTHLMSIPVTCSDVERAAIIMDTLHYGAVEKVLPYYYERVCYKGLRDEDSIEMLEIIRETRYLNWGLSYGWLDSIEPAVHAMLVEGNGNTSTLTQAAVRVVNTLIGKTMDSLK